MVHILYILTILPLLWEFKILLNPNKMLSDRKSISEKGDFDRFTDEEKVITLFNTVYFIWAILGLFTFQWYAFAALLLITLLPLKKRAWTIVIDCLLSIVVLTFIMLNAYIFKIKVQILIDVTGTLTLTY